MHGNKPTRKLISRKMQEYAILKKIRLSGAMGKIARVLILGMQAV